MAMNPIRMAPITVAFLLAFSVGCSGDDDAPASSTPKAASSQSDGTQYVDRVCTAAATMYTAYKKSFNDNLATLGGMDPTDAYAKTARQPFAALIAELEKLTPPADAAADHSETIRQAKDVLDAITRNDRQKLLALRGTPDTGKWKQVIDLAPGLKTRYGQASQQVASCKALEQSGGGNPFQ